MRSLLVTSEYYPLIKTGGLADVCGALPPALAAQGVDARVLLPGYPAVLDAVRHTVTVAPLPDLFGGQGRLLRGRAPDDTVLYLVDAPHLFARGGGPYLDPAGQDWPDNHLRFAALSWVGAHLPAGNDGWQPQIVHAHDWQAGLAPLYLRSRPDRRPRSVVTIHNLAFQGLYPSWRMNELRLSPEHFTADGFEFHGQIGFLKAGLVFADRITTVSPTYAREIMSAEAGAGLDGLLRHRSAVVSGILNGLDTTVWDPAKDTALPAAYAANDLSGKATCKSVLQRRMRLGEARNRPLFGVVSRLTQQKGLDLLASLVPAIVRAGGQLALLGTGEPGLEATFRQAAEDHAGHVGVLIGYDEQLAHLILGGADALIVPSRFEPCGLTQLQALRYGTLPVVSRVGGLADTVIDANTAALADGAATGFVFAPSTAAALADAIGRALALFSEPDRWRSIQRRAMSRDVGWTRPAQAYRALYQDLLQADSTA
ncbi:glycogen synthase GlgA [Marinivivus vitaminiproducens]|uniref:glycogen synthase GlgA n=1 Tax=Marinivivus vitaminiproducens TaxID=3035935 RepID=UPI0027A7BFB8|nr:glycogen synthase GlgA [Geminicoccaceae bacterium SCSIO 64248]